MKTLGQIAFVAGLGLLTIGHANSAWGQANQPPQNPGVPANTTDPNANAGVNAGSNPGANTAAGSYSTLNRNPWFAYPSVRQHLGLTDQQYNQLSRGYDQSWNQYNQDMTQLNTNLTDLQRAKRNQDLLQTFHAGVGQSADGVFGDGTGRQRFNQLGLQYRGFGSFTDPNIQQQLSLTDTQRQRFDRFNNDWNARMENWNRTFATNPNLVRREFRQAQPSFQNNVYDTLTLDQQQQWNTMTGKAFEFPADAYFHNGTSAITTTPNPVVE